MRRPSHPPRLLLADAAGNVVDHPRLEAVGVDGTEPGPVPRAAWVPIPPGSDLHLLPGRAAIGRDPRTRRMVEIEDADLVACSAFLAPAWTRSHLPAYRLRPGAPALPLFGYSAVGLADGEMWAPARRVDPDPRQDPATFRFEAVRKGAFVVLAAHPENRVLQQLTRCALDYCCRAAQNYFLGRHEVPLPTSVACNAQCVGCISLQPSGDFRASHERLTRRVKAAEIVDVVLDHWSRVPDAVASFGQGCEGEPLLEGEVLVEAVARLRRRTQQGTLNLNTNASLPAVVAKLADAGLDSMRVSLNSARPRVYAAYYNPRHYSFADVEASVRVMKSRGRRVSTNFLYFPGVSDTEPELRAFASFLARTGIDMVQVRNLNVDPDVYRAALPRGTVGRGMGLDAWMRRLRAGLPRLAFGYFNPTKERYAELERGVDTRGAISTRCRPPGRARTKATASR